MLSAPLMWSSVGREQHRRNKVDQARRALKYTHALFLSCVRHTKIENRKSLYTYYIHSSLLTCLL